MKLLYFVILYISLEAYGLEKVLLRDNSLSYPFKFQHWDFGGNTFIANNKVVVTKNQPNERGMLWNTAPLLASEWEIVLTFKVHGRGRYYGDGMALWYMDQRPTAGHAFGCQERFKGLGIFLDTYNNDRTYQQTFPYITGMINSGSDKYDHDSDGKDFVFEGCSPNYRNPPQETNLLIRYVNRTLTVFHDVGQKVDYNVDSKGSWQPCFEKKEIDLPRGYYLSVCSLTGELHDFHEVYSIMTYEIQRAPEVIKEDVQLTPKQEEAPKEPQISQDHSAQDLSDEEILPIWILIGLACVAIILVLVLLTVLYPYAIQYRKDKSRFY